MRSLRAKPSRAAALERRARRLRERLEAILIEHPGADRDNVRHTLLLLDEAPVDRLERGLTRGSALVRHR